MLNALSADFGSFSISDIVVIAILALGLITGIAMGFARMLRGGVGTIIALTGAIVCAIFLSTMLADAVFSELSSTIETKIVEFSEATGLTAKIDGKTIMVLNKNGWVALADCFGGTGIKAKIATMAQPVLIALCNDTLAGGTSTIAAATASLTVTALAGVIIFVVGIIVIEILFTVLASLFSSLCKKQKAFRTLDRVLGLVFSAVITVVLVFAVFFVIEKLGTRVEVAADFIRDGTVGKWFFDNNPFSVLLG